MQRRWRYSNAITDMTFEGSVVRGRGTVKVAALDDKSMMDVMETCRDGGARKRNPNQQRKNAPQSDFMVATLSHTFFCFTCPLRPNLLGIGAMSHPVSNNGQHHFNVVAGLACEPQNRWLIS